MERNAKNSVAPEDVAAKMNPIRLLQKMKTYKITTQRNIQSIIQVDGHRRNIKNSLMEYWNMETNGKKCRALLKRVAPHRRVLTHKSFFFESKRI